ncbi:UDP-glucose dehydrogenase family protein [Amycolatopsis aidingensis]|uniref:UDP-glucose dehydrogenase family protein n=1 Tax=Amycolatopsis aidingensis TaxID=2842453 RepID=UPI001C0B9649|nr:UDP-glucose/GDP-mannose dehydrogenase family protein [Amycolatopsis aidingensis]
MTGAPAVGVVGAGYVGLTTAACLAHLGHRVVCVEADARKARRLRDGEVPISEPGLTELVRAGLAAATLSFTTEVRRLRRAGIVFLCLPTPMGADGDADLGALEAELVTLSGVLARECVLVTKSTVPVGTARRAARMLARPDVRLVSNPEFLREGHAVRDFLRPSRIVIGAEDAGAAERVAALYAGVDAPVLRTDPASAELAKYASNAFLAVKLSYMNELAELCERLGADITEVGRVMGLDARIGTAFLAPGPGWGGSCLPKDTRALLRSAPESGGALSVVRAAVLANEAQRERILGKVCRAVTGRPDGSLAGLRIGVLGLTFKAGTDDLRHSPALAIAHGLAERGATVTGYDPEVAATEAARLAPVQVADDPYLVGKDAAGIVLLTEWPQFRELDWARLAATTERALVVDTRNLLDTDRLARAGFAQVRLGGKAPRPAD